MNSKPYWLLLGFVNVAITLVPPSSDTRIIPYFIIGLSSLYCHIVSRYFEKHITRPLHSRILEGASIVLLQIEAWWYLYEAIWQQGRHAFDLGAVPIPFIFFCTLWGGAVWLGSLFERKDRNNYLLKWWLRLSIIGVIVVASFVPSTILLSHAQLNVKLIVVGAQVLGGVSLVTIGLIFRGMIKD